MHFSWHFNPKLPIIFNTEANLEISLTLGFY